MRSASARSASSTFAQAAAPHVLQVGLGAQPRVPGPRELGLERGEALLGADRPAAGPQLVGVARIGRDGVARPGRDGILVGHGHGVGTLVFGRSRQAGFVGVQRMLGRQVGTSKE